MSACLLLLNASLPGKVSILPNTTHLLHQLKSRDNSNLFQILQTFVLSKFMFRFCCTLRKVLLKFICFIYLLLYFVLFIVVFFLYSQKGFVEICFIYLLLYSVLFIVVFSAEGSAKAFHLLLGQAKCFQAPATNKK